MAHDLGDEASAFSTAPRGASVFTLIDQNVYAIGVGWNILKDVVVTIDHGP